MTADLKAMTDTIWLGKIEEEACTVGDISERSKDILSVKNFQLNPLTKMRNGKIQPNFFKLLA